jgi:hypothetical protein
MSLRRLLTDIYESLRRIEDQMTANDDALTALNTAVEANTAATTAAVSALGSASGGSDDISAGVNAAAATVEANTAALTGATTSPPAGAADGTGTPGAVTNEAGTPLPPQ